MSTIELLVAVLPILGSVFWSTFLAWRHIDSQFDFLRERINEISANAELQYERTRGEVTLLQEKIDHLEEATDQLCRFLSTKGFIRRSGDRN